MSNDIYITLVAETDENKIIEKVIKVTEETAGFDFEDLIKIKLLLQNKLGFKGIEFE